MTISIKTLQRDTGKYIEKVKDGEHFTLTRDGEPFARLFRVKDLDAVITSARTYGISGISPFTNGQVKLIKVVDFRGVFLVQLTHQLYLERDYVIVVVQKGKPIMAIIPLVANITDVLTEKARTMGEIQIPRVTDDASVIDEMFALLDP